MKKQDKDWIIASGTDTGHHIVMRRFRGTENELRRILVGEVEAAKNEDPDNFVKGTENPENVSQNAFSEYRAFAEFNDARIDITAMAYDEIRDGDMLLLL